MFRNKHKILLIEDDQSRVEWLKDRYGDIADIEWHTSVKQFVSAYTFKKWDLVIFDFDLTPDFATPIFNEDKGLWIIPTSEIGQSVARFDCDENDMNGLDAAKLIPSSNLYDKNQKFLIWSMNPDGAEKIYSALTKHGYVNIVKKRFNHFHKDSMKPILEQLLRQ